MSSETRARSDFEPADAQRPILGTISRSLTPRAIVASASMWKLLAALSIPMWLFIMYWARTQVWSRAYLGTVFLGYILLLYVFHELAKQVDDGGPAEADDESAEVESETAGVDDESAEVESETAGVDGEAAEVDGEAAEVDGETAEVDGETTVLWSQLRELFAPGNRLETLVLLLSAGLIVIVTGYIALNIQAIQVDQAGQSLYRRPHRLWLAVIFTFVMCFMTYRSFGTTFLAVVVVGILYALYGNYVPGLISHSGISYERTLRILVMSGDDGFFGFLTQLVAAWIALFLLYAGLLKSYGAFDLILRIAVRSGKYLSSGVAQTAVVASAVIGSVNGSQTANAGMTGSFTIPMMKRNGVKPETAGGIEAVASTAGQVLPPVMGAGAFIMATLIFGVSYFDVIVAGMIPAVVLVVSIVIAVHYAAGPQIDEPDLDSFFDTTLTRFDIALESIKFGIPLLVLIYILGILQWTVGTAALWTAVSMIALGITVPTAKAAYLGREVSGSGLEWFRVVFWKFVDTLEQTVDGSREGVVVLAPVAIILAAINGVVDLFVATGIPGRITLTIMAVSDGTLIVAAILAMAICIMLGLGMPTTAAYTIVAFLVAPTFINQFFIPDLAAHFFVFYAAILAGLTPPIATCVAVTCGISGGNFWGSCKEAIKISAPLFILPFTFLYHPEMVSGEFNYASLSAGVFAMLGALAIIHGINYRYAFGRLPSLALGTAYFGLGIVAMVHPSQPVQIGAVGAVGALYFLQVFAGKPDPVGTFRTAAAGFNGRRRAD